MLEKILCVKHFELHLSMKCAIISYTSIISTTVKTRVKKLHWTFCAVAKHLPLETHAKLVKHNGKPWKELEGLTPCQKCNCQSILLQRQLEQQALWIFNQKVEKLSAMRHHLLWAFWPCFLSSLAMPDMPLEGLSACGNGWATLQRTHRVRQGLNHERTAWKRQPSDFTFTVCWAVKERCRTLEQPFSAL